SRIGCASVGVFLEDVEARVRDESERVSGLEVNVSGDLVVFGRPEDVGVVLRSPIVAAGQRMVVRELTQYVGFECDLAPRTFGGTVAIGQGGTAKSGYGHTQKDSQKQRTRHDKTSTSKLALHRKRLGVTLERWLRVCAGAGNRTRNHFGSGSGTPCLGT